MHFGSGRPPLTACQRAKVEVRRLVTMVAQQQQQQWRRRRGGGEQKVWSYK